MLLVAAAPCRVTVDVAVEELDANDGHDDAGEDGECAEDARVDGEELSAAEPEARPTSGISSHPMNRLASAPTGYAARFGS